ncbi:ATPase Cu transporting protein 7B, partial [Massospora cicadina]
VSSVEIGVKGMTCQSCVKSIEASLGSLEGIISIYVSLEKEAVTVDFDAALHTLGSISSAIEDCGFDVVRDRLFSVEGMTSQTCVKSINAVFEGTEGLLRIQVSLDKGSALVSFISPLTEERIVKMIEECGFDAVPVNSGGEVGGPAGAPAEVSLRVQGMRCQSCVKSIESAVFPLPGVVLVEVSLERELARVNFVPPMTVDGLVEAIEGCGFDVTYPYNTQSHAQISIRGMTCNSCMKSIQATLSNAPGIVQIDVSLEKESAFVLYDSSTIPLRK